MLEEILQCSHALCMACGQPAPAHLSSFRYVCSSCLGAARACLSYPRRGDRRSRRSREDRREHVVCCEHRRRGGRRVMEQRRPTLPQAGEAVRVRAPHLLSPSAIVSKSRSRVYAMPFTSLIYAPEAV